MTPINDRCTLHEGTGCIVFGDSVVELTVREEELLELLLETPRITVRHDLIVARMVVSRATVDAFVKTLRVKLGRQAIRTHHRRGYSVQPQFVLAPSMRVVRRGAA